MNTIPNHNSNNILSKVIHLYILVASLGFLFLSLHHPNQTWDTLGYAASVISLEESDKATIHSSVYNEYTNYVTQENIDSKEVYEDVLDISSYHQTMAKDPEAFYQQIPFYKIRIAFIASISALANASKLNIFTSAHLLSALFTCLGFLIFYYAYKRIIHPAFWLVAPLFFMIFDVYSVARTVTADTIAFFWVALICYTFIREKWLPFFILLVTSVLIRTDLIVLVLLFSVYLFFSQKHLRGRVALTFLASIGTYFFITYSVDNHGWGTVFYFAIVSKMQATHPLEYGKLGISLSQYLAGVKGNLLFLALKTPLQVFAAVVLLQLILKTLFQKNLRISILLLNTFKNPVLMLTVISTLYVVLHYLIFPHPGNRFFISQYMIGGLNLLVILSELISYKTSATSKS